MLPTYDTFPDDPVTGQMFWHSGLNMLFLFNGSDWTLTTVAKDWFLFVDDLREPADAGWFSGDILVARSSAEAMAIVEEKGLPARISFDHDLGGDDTAFKFMWALINGHLDEKWNLAEVQAIQIHSANGIGAKKLEALWENFCRVQKLEIPIVRVWPKEVQ